MPETWFIADTHFGHANIIKFEATRPFRPFDTIQEHDAYIVKQWNSVVAPKDTVYHLGDVAFGAKNLDILGQLNGDKRLIMGNHDSYQTREYMRYFTKLHGVKAWHNWILSHIPLHIGQLERFAVNIHGHLHTRVLDDPRYVNVACEQIGLTPIHADAIRKQLEYKG